MPIQNSVLDHIAIATNAPAELKKVLTLLGLADQGSEKVEDQGVITHFLRAETTQTTKKIAEATAVELLEPIDPQGVIAKFLAKRGPGIHHFCVRVVSIEQATDELVRHGIKLVYPAAKTGAHGRLVNFIHPTSAGGILIEVSQ